MYRDSKHRCMREKLQGHGKPYQIGQKEEEEEDEKKKKLNRNEGWSWSIGSFYCKKNEVTVRYNTHKYSPHAMYLSIEVGFFM